MKARGKALVIVFFALFVLAVSFALLVLFEGTAAYLPEMKNANGLAWSCPEGICISWNGGTKTATLQVLGKKGKAVKMPRFGFWKSGIVYWSPNDSDVGFVDESGQTHWLNIEQDSIQNVAEALPTGCEDTLWLNLYSRACSFPYMGVLQLEPRDEGTHVRADRALIEVKSDNDGFLARLDAAARLTIESCRNMSGSTKGSTVLDMNFCHMRDWDFDGKRGLLFCLTKYSLYIVGNGVFYRSVFPSLLEPAALEVATASKEVWVFCHKPFQFGNVLLVFDYQGRLKGRRSETYIGFGKPCMYELNTRQIAMLRRLVRR